jgi:predicted ATPase
MYLKNIAIKNIGPIDELSVELPFHENGVPKPIIFVGENGTGKTILQSQIIDGFYEIGGNLFDDIKKTAGMGYQYFKVSGGINLKTGSENGFSLLRFENDENINIEYFDKVNKVTKEDFTKLISDFSLSPNNKKDNQKEITNLNSEQEEKLKKEWKTGAYFYQPAYRYEEPFWKNDSFFSTIKFEDKKKFSGKLYKNIEILSSTKENKSYLMDLVLDFANSPNTVDQVIWIVINNILKKIKQKENVRFGIGPRGGYRVSIVEQDNNSSQIKELLPSIDNLSLGESLLLNLFINIIRHADNPPKICGQIKGMVAIDEIDVHLHTDLQNNVLPELIKMFPNVQFIITTHSPLFLLGMKRHFGEDNFEIRNLPNGEIITTERFSEFENAYKALKATEKFEQELKIKTEKSNKPIVYVEGPTDVKYIKKAYELLESSSKNFNLDIIGEETNLGTNCSNDKALKNAGKFLETNTKLLKQKVILLHDPENSITETEKEDVLFVRRMPKFEKAPLQNGIENLFLKTFIEKVTKHKKNCFQYHVVGEERKSLKILDGKKQEVCNWICNNAEKKDFKNFKEIISILSDIMTPQK